MIATLEILCLLMCIISLVLAKASKSSIFYKVCYSIACVLFAVIVLTLEGVTK